MVFGDASEWEHEEEFIKMLDILHDLKGHIEYANTKKDVEHLDNVILITTDHQEIFQDLRKKSL